jgi:hypothetical protein
MDHFEAPAFLSDHRARRSNQTCRCFPAASRPAVAVGFGRVVRECTFGVWYGDLYG